MLDRDKLTQEAADFKKDAKKHYDAAVAALLALAWQYDDLGANFRFDAIPGLFEEALRICREMSDKCVEGAKKRLYEAVSGSPDYMDEDTAWDIDAEAVTDRFDMAGSHLLDLLSIWVAVALVNGWTKGYTKVMMSRYMVNPFLCPQWRNIPLTALSWGSGYARNILEQLAVIGQNAIISGAMYVEWVNEMANGATYYVRRRGSGYYCPQCDAACGVPIPINQPFELLHSRCMCWPQYFYGPME